MTSDGSTLVASRRPPSPASITPNSTPAAASATKATAVAASNWVIDSPSSSARLTTSTDCATRSTDAANASGSISAPPIRTRSDQRLVCGER